MDENLRFFEARFGVHVYDVIAGCPVPKNPLRLLEWKQYFSSLDKSRLQLYLESENERRTQKNELANPNCEATSWHKYSIRELSSDETEIIKQHIKKIAPRFGGWFFDIDLEDNFQLNSEGRRK